MPFVPCHEILSLRFLSAEQKLRVVRIGQGWHGPLRLYQRAIAVQDPQQRSYFICGKSKFRAGEDGSIFGKDFI